MVYHITRKSASLLYRQSYAECAPTLGGWYGNGWGWGWGWGWNNGGDAAGGIVPYHSTDGLTRPSDAATESSDVAWNSQSLANGASSWDVMQNLPGTGAPTWALTASGNTTINLATAAFGLPTSVGNLAQFQPAAVLEAGGPSAVVTPVVYSGDSADSVDSDSQAVVQSYADATSDTLQASGQYEFAAALSAQSVPTPNLDAMMQEALAVPNAQCTYDAQGDLTQVTDPVGNVTTFTYNSQGQETSESENVNGSTVTQSSTYDSAGNVTQVVDADGRVRIFSYNSQNQCTQETWYNDLADAEAQTNATNTISYTYYADGEVESVSDNSSATTYQYNDAGQVADVTTQVGDGPAVKLAYTYDPTTGEETSVTATVAGTADFQNAYSYNSSGQLTEIQQSGQAGGNAVAPQNGPVLLRRFGQPNWNDLLRRSLRNG